MHRESILAHEDSGRCHAEVSGLCATGKGHMHWCLGKTPVRVKLSGAALLVLTHVQVTDTNLHIRSRLRLCEV